MHPDAWLRSEGSTSAGDSFGWLWRACVAERGTISGFLTGDETRCSRHVDAEIHPDVIEPGAVIIRDVKEHQVAGIEDIQAGWPRPGVLDQDGPGRALVDLE